VRRYLPALLSLGSALGIALHSLLYNWDTYITVGRLMAPYTPSSYITVDRLMAPYTPSSTIGTPT
jgi:hypothetical protein